MIKGILTFIGIILLLLLFNKWIFTDYLKTPKINNNRSASGSNDDTSATDHTKQGRAKQFHAEDIHINATVHHAKGTMHVTSADGS